MGAIPTQRETASCAPDAPARVGADTLSAGTAYAGADRRAVVRVSLPGGPLAPGAARRFVGTALGEWAELDLPGAAALSARLVEDALVVVSELVTNAVVHAGTDVELLCRLGRDDPASAGWLLVEVSDHHPSRAVRDEGAERPYLVERPYGAAEYGRGLRLVAALSEAWGITYRTGMKTVWARLSVDGAMAVEDAFGAYGGEVPGVGGAGISGTVGAGDVGEVAGTEGDGAVEGGAGGDDWRVSAYAGDGEVRGVRGARAYAGGVGHGDEGGPELGPDPVDLVAPVPRLGVERDREWLNRGALSFLAEASDLLAGQLDEDLVAALAGQLLVPRLADWCAVWLEDEGLGWRGGDGSLGPAPRLARVWHGSENRIEELRRALEQNPPRLPESVRSRAVPVPWPEPAAGDRPSGVGDRGRTADGEGAPTDGEGASRDGGGASAGSVGKRDGGSAGERLGGSPGLSRGGAVRGREDGAAPECDSGAAPERAGGAAPECDGGIVRGRESRAARECDGETGRERDDETARECEGGAPSGRAGGAAPECDGGIVRGRESRAAQERDGETGRERDGETGRERDGGAAWERGGEVVREREGGAALAYRLIAGGRPLGTLVIGRAGLLRFPDEVTGLVEDLSRRIALSIGAARQYARQATISRVLQRGLLPGAVAEIPGVSSALVYEPCDKGGPSGDFYDLFPAGRGRWCFAIGDVQGKGPEAAVVIGLARPWLRLLAREGYGVADVLDRLNQLLLDDATEAADAAARALVTAGDPGLVDPDGPQIRFLSLLYGELVPVPGGVRCTLASAGHPLPLLLGPDGDVRTVAEPQTLLGVIEDTEYVSETFELRCGDTLLCVTDGVTERRSGPRMFDDGDGLATALSGCAGLDAQLIAERIRRLVHEFGERPPDDDLALLVLRAE
ncbi:SpoIIE family protein phosphatase [Streptomyces caniscabiei]|uniref:SpoIIE family protein phosphatase n=2 Tax=Streptomyces caniscabiei TaxID=2746961 RepID=A0ABU4MV86_9ACTN|nr:SpoIIE family protein phosphatase [Streptomyces caniscabiei]MBE4737683.1 SpoIIE family protein phosphatase [Streptomyces caniscabiei]MBE4762356.1 SpoIIE family protein phosphatase [Streptomyces caniscabiei]MBE4769517.1 SpoIIE family protein phosphatase [Streptomyces caniscabiei]MBE4784762.1 SpoIIE family protein phosphatase [Streptomyces caniscabiei]MBE4795546.1 SpoIIE family protein phosphatase [Streptomyces caniscabiei]